MIRTQTGDIQLTSKQRFLAVLNGDQPDRTPVGHISALTTVELQEHTGCWMPHVHHDPEQLARLCAANHSVLGFDFVTFIINYFNEPAAVGAEIDWGGPSQYPTFTSHPWRDDDAVCVPAGLLEKPAVRTYLDAIRIAVRDYGETIAVLGKVMGPFSMVQAMCGIENVMIDVLDNPDRVKHRLNVAVDILVSCANAQLELGALAVSIGEGGAGANMLSPRMYDDLLVDVHRDMLQRIDGPTIMHICGDITARLDSIAEIGLDFLHFDWAIAPRTMKQAADGRFKLIGNINTTDLLMAGPQDIERQVAENIEAGVHMIAPGCATSPNCPNANFIAMANAAKR